MDNANFEKMMDEWEAIGVDMPPEHVARGMTEVETTMPSWLPADAAIPLPMVKRLMTAAWIRGFAAHGEDLKPIIERIKDAMKRQAG